MWYFEGSYLLITIFFINPFPGETQKMNLFQSLTNAMDIILDSDPTSGK